jgi:hypothetical protein
VERYAVNLKISDKKQEVQTMDDVTREDTNTEEFGVYTATEKAAAGAEGNPEQLRNKYKTMDGKIYEIVTSIQEDDENGKEFDFIFRKPGTPSYDRYVKTSGTSGTKALKTFVLDNICDEQRGELRDALEEYPAMAISLGEKLLNMLGLSKETTVKKL